MITIGPAGELKMAAANISVKEPGSHIRSCGRGGLGVVLGEKRVKFIALEATSTRVEIARPEEFQVASRAFAKALVDNPISQTHPGCVINCSQIYPGADKKYLTSGFEYESIWTMRTDCCVDNLDHIAEADRLPEFFKTEPLAQHNVVWDVKDAAIDAFCDF